MRINANKLAPFFFVSDHVVMVTSAAVPAVVGIARIGTLGYWSGKALPGYAHRQTPGCCYNANRFTSILWRTTTNSDQVSAPLFWNTPSPSLTTVIVGLALRRRKSPMPALQHPSYRSLRHHAALHQRFIGDDQRLLIPRRFTSSVKAPTAPRPNHAVRSESFC